MDVLGRPGGLGDRRGAVHLRVAESDFRACSKGRATRAGRRIRIFTSVSPHVRRGGGTWGTELPTIAIPEVVNSLLQISVRHSACRVVRLGRWIEVCRPRLWRG